MFQLGQKATSAAFTAMSDSIPRAGINRVASDHPTGRAKARPMMNSAISGAKSAARKN
jgi:hypothetical protein